MRGRVRELLGAAERVAPVGREPGPHTRVRIPGDRDHVSARGNHREAREPTVVPGGCGRAEHRAQEAERRAVVGASSDPDLTVVGVRVGDVDQRSGRGDRGPVDAPTPDDRLAGLPAGARASVCVADELDHARVAVDQREMDLGPPDRVHEPPAGGDRPVVAVLALRVEALAVPQFVPFALPRS